MSKFDLRDVQQRLTGSRDVDAVVNEFLGYLQSARADWKAHAFFTAMQQQQVGVGKRPALPGNPGREPPGVGATHQGAGRPLSCCQ